MTDVRSTEIEQNEDGLRVVRCGHCLARIVWAERLETGHRFALNADPDRAGDTVVEDRGQGRAIGHLFSGRNLSSMRIRMDAGGTNLYRRHECEGART